MASLALFLCSGCMAHHHSVGLGPTGTGEQVERQWYILFGLVAANDIDPQRMAAGLTSYSVTSEYGLIDILLAPFLLPFTVTTRTVTVRS